MTPDPIYILGDVHGEWPTLFWMCRYRWRIRDCILISVGDFGAGFEQSRSEPTRVYGYWSRKFSKIGVKLLVIRGNHDDPYHFQGQFNFPNLELIPDYTFRSINGIDFLFVGGAISVDRSDTRRRIDGKSWWKEEGFVLNPDLCRKCDVLITHSSPTWVGPTDKSGIIEWEKNDPGLINECYEERKKHDELVRLCQPTKGFAGHFHSYHNSLVDGCDYTILDTMTIKELRL